MLNAISATANDPDELAALAQRMGLIEYWKIHRPGFCGEPNPAAVCGSLAKS